MQKFSVGRAKAPDVFDQNVRKTPVTHSRTIRFDDKSVVTSGFAGKFLPVAMIPLLREDAVSASSIMVNVDMSETADLIMNPVRATAVAYLVPKLAFSRFNGIDAIDRSYNGIPEADGSTIPWFQQIEFSPDSPFFKTLGLHRASGSMVNTDYLESYNAVWNHIAKERSVSLELRTDLDETLAPAFWEHSQMKYIKPTFDAALMEGEVPVAIDAGKVRVNSEATATAGARIRNLDGSTSNSQAALKTSSTGRLVDNSGTAEVFLDPQGTLFADFVETSGTISLANIDLARKTQAWAKLRSMYQGHSEEWMIDQLLAGIPMPYENLRHPILLDHKDVVFGMSQRYATDGQSLSQSVAQGNASVELRIGTPPISTGGVVVVCVQILPEQLFERQQDVYLVASDVSELPDRTSDELDPQPVDVVSNVFVDEAHSLPEDIFGYAPLNHQWMRSSPRVGGKYYRSDPSAPWTEDRNRIWDTNVIDPKLGTDFYIASEIHHDVFADSNSDPFEVVALGRVAINGLTYFGPALREATDDYQRVLDKIELDRIKPPAADPVEEEPEEDYS